MLTEILGTFFILWLLFVILCIVTLIRQAKKKQWVWFVLTLLFAPVLVIYWICKLLKIIK